ncbi:glycosyltransferase [Phyllobacterium zundukense]|uniref:Glycosyl transferase n=1 Tax=Phyllobacterium zundukense TaxID=1867719 RepID=A0A2N9VSA6_9HYPH|nr:glycosyltransferase [Phyllobacterium zundukense]PIO42374.1 hypothetical protein B5P45_25495 [Phyllobacterium zundukense]
MPKSLIIGAFRQAFVNGTSFIEELYASGKIYQALIARCIAEEVGLVFEDIPADVRVVLPTGSDLVALRDIRHTVVLTPDDTTLIYMVPTMSDIEVIKRNLPESPNIAARLRVTTPSVLAGFLRSSHEKNLVDGAIRMVEMTNSEHSARIVATGKQGAAIGVLIASCLFTLVLNPQLLWLLLHVLFSLFFSACILLRLFARNNIGNVEGRSIQTFSPADLPTYSVMIALYQEADVIPQLVTAMMKLNWPRSKLEVLFLCEADDCATIAALQAEILLPCFRIIPVPCAHPRTKPKALNYGLQLAKGDLVVVYDAEDRPHPDQLLEAWRRFTTSGENLGCVQAPLVIVNAYEGWLARLFAFEYAVHFRGILPWLARNGFVLPLGGSSNHFRRDCLETTVGGWDPFNVTEDAELGTRLARHGLQVDMLSLPTFEDAPVDAGVWLRQRTRWLKGWMQTWLVEMRHPVRLLNQLGIQRFVVYHLLATGMIVSALLYPMMLVFVALSACYLAFADTTATQPVLLIIDLLNILMGYVSFHALGSRALKREKMPGLVLPWIPLYWLMISAAAWRSLWQLHNAPFLWEKTPHRPAKTRVVANQ